MSLDTTPSEVLQIIFRSLYPPGFFSDIDWLAAYGLEHKGDVNFDVDDEEDEDEDEDDSDGSGEDNDNSDTDLSDGEDDIQHVDDSEGQGDVSPPNNDADSRTAREIAAWEQVTEADETMRSISQTCRHLRTTSQIILQDHVRLETEKAKMKITHLDWATLRNSHGTTLSDAKGEYPDSISDWNKTWTTFGESLRGLHIPAWAVEKEKIKIVDLLWGAIAKAQLREVLAARRPRLWWPRPDDHSL